jgi:hypothetical protein
MAEWEGVKGEGDDVNLFISFASVWLFDSFFQLKLCFVQKYVIDKMLDFWKVIT